MNGLPCVVLQKVELFQIMYLFLNLYLYFTSRHLQILLSSTHIGCGVSLESMSLFRGSFNFWVDNSQFRKILRTVT